MCVECDVPHSTYKNIKINKGKEKREWKEMGKHQECRDRQSMKCLVFPARANLFGWILLSVCLYANRIRVYTYN